MLWPNGSKTRPYLSSPFGPREAPGEGASTFHRGADFTGFSEVRAIARGTVHVAGVPSGWSAGGNQVWIQHDGFFTRSMHLSSTSVHAGQPIEEGAVIGIMGATGTAYGVHLHLELSPGAVNYGNSSQIDPVPFIEARLNQEEDDMFSDSDRAKLDVLLGRTAAPTIPLLVQTADPADTRVFVLMETGQIRHIGPTEKSAYVARAAALGYAREDFDRLFIHRIGNIGNLPGYNPPA